jgi:MFS family permease
VSASLVNRFGIRWPLVAGLLCAAIGLLLFARAPVDGRFVADILPGMLLLGLGAGVAFNPLLLAAMGDVDESESGLASGIVNTSFMMGGALGLAVLASLAAAHAGAAPAHSGSATIAALNGGYRLAFAAGAAFAAVAAALGATLLPLRPPRSRA